jgi:hypothetical protein
MKKRQRLACGATIGALSCLVVITVLAQDTLSGLEPSAEAEAAADPVAAEAAVAKADSSADDGAHRLNFCRCAGHGSQVAAARIEHALRGPLSANGMDYADVPLEEVVNLLQEEYGIPIKINEAALEETGLDPSEPVTINVHNISLRSALRLMLNKLNLTYIIQNEVLHITTPSDVDAHLLTCVYDARPFLAATDDASVKSLMDTIVACVSKDTWSRNGKGEAEIRFLKPGLLVISQTQDVHDEIASLLRAIQAMREKPANQGDAVDRQPALK